MHFAETYKTLCFQTGDDPFNILRFFNINYFKVIFTFIADYHILIPHLITFKLTFWAYILTQINNKKRRKSFLPKNSSHPLKLISSLQITIALHLLFRLGFSFQHRMWKLRCIPLSISVVLPAPSIKCSLLIFRRRNNCCSHFLQNQVSFEKYCHSATPWASGLTHKEQWEPWRQTFFFFFPAPLSPFSLSVTKKQQHREQCRIYTSIEPFQLPYSLVLT